MMVMVQLWDHALYLMGFEPLEIKEKGKCCGLQREWQIILNL